jgi:hypothetical protein
LVNPVMFHGTGASGSFLAAPQCDTAHINGCLGVVSFTLSGGQL